jgi:predicted dehydrogenase
VTSTIETGWWQPHADGICGSTLVFGIRGFGRVFPTSLEMFNDTERAPLKIESGFPPSRIEEDFEAMYRAQMAYFLECVRSGQQPDPDSRESAINMRILDAAYQSSTTGEVVRL